MPGPRVRGVINAHQMIKRELRIALSRRQTAVSQEFLHTAQIRPGFQQMCGKGVAQSVRRNHCGQTGAGAQSGDDARRLATLQPRAAPSYEDRRLP